MGKNHQHKKKLKSEKAKVHITSKTKFLPKGLNVTNTTFKVKAILIQEQLKEKDQSQLLSRRKENIQELLTKLRHYNESVRTDACGALCEMIKHHAAEVISNHLSSIVQAASLLVQDRDRKARRACVKLFNAILANTSPAKLDPFFGHISTHLRCAMTNINRNIQDDSLLLLDSLLAHAPTLVAKNSEKIFPDFLALISKIRNDSGFDRTLTLNLGSKITSVRWRIKVLSRLYGLLDAMLNRQNGDGSRREGGVVTRRASDSSYVPLYGDSTVFENCTIDFFNNNNNSGVDNSNVLNLHVVTLVPLLYETWLEVVPEKTLTKTTDATNLSEESAAILSCIVNILYLLNKYAEINRVRIFTSKDTDKFLDHLITHFPYGQHKRQKQEPLLKDVSIVFTLKDDPRCVDENLLIAYLFLALRSMNFSKDCRDRLDSVTTYVNSCLVNSRRLGGDNVKYLLLILEEILLKRPKIWQKFGINTQKVMEKSLDFYQNTPKGHRAKVLDILSNCQLFDKSPKYQEWLGNLPDLLCEEEVNEEVVDVILTLSKQNCEVIQNRLRTKLGAILENLDQVKIPSNEEAVKLKIAHIFFYVPHLDEEKISNYFLTRTGSSYWKHFSTMLQLRKQMHRI